MNHCGYFTTLLILTCTHTDVFLANSPTLDDHQVVTPQLVHQRWRRHMDGTNTHYQSEDPESLIYSITINNTLHHLHLTKNTDFLSPDFTMLSYDVLSDTMKTLREKPTSCHYSGWVSGYEGSLVALTTCNGLRGVIFINNQSYGLEPDLHGSNNEHFLFTLHSKQTEPFVCGVDSEWDHVDDDNSSAHHTWPLGTLLREKRSLPQTRYVELVLVVDNLRFKYKNSSYTAVKDEMVQLSNLVDTYYQQLNIRIVLVGVVVFETGNPFNVTADARIVLGQFVNWRKDNLTSQIRNDMSQLVVGLSESYSGGILGMAFVGSVCSASTGGGISVFSGNDLQYYSTIIAHEMGHNLGMNHDTTNCTCNRGSCIMSPTASGSTFFSACSDQAFEALIQRQQGLCLLNVPSQNVTISIPVCGNGLLEAGEQCDCGTPQTCNNKCCNAATCTLTKGSACATGLCCQNCQFVVSGTPCRDSVNQCDLPEFCNGLSAFCPADFYLMDGLTCESGSAYCFEGRCQTLDYQCKQLFGQSAVQANAKCFSYVNTQGTQYGNCGYSGSTLVPCSVQNSMCGKIQCTGFDANNPPSGGSVSVVDIEPGISCKNADFQQGPDVLDPGYIKTGTVCAANKVCIKFQCVNSSKLTEGQNCDAGTDCNSNGVCNDLGHCHCNKGWAPPQCNTWGRGGSVDSGPTQIDYSLRNGLLIFFLLVLPVLVLIVFGLLYIFRRDALRNSCWSRCFKRQRTNEGSAQMRANTQPPPPPPRPVTPIKPPLTTQQAYPSATSGAPASSNGQSNVQPVVVTSPLPRTGPGVPRPIPPRNVVT